MGHAVRTIAFPAISTGIYGFPLARVTRIAVTETARFPTENAEIEEVRFVCFGTETYHINRATIDATTNEGERRQP